MRAEPFPLTLARLHLHAVLPALEELARLSPEARAIAEKWPFSLRLQVAGRGGPSATLVSPGDGTLIVHPQSAQPVRLVLTFLSAGQLNRTFLDQKTLPPLPTGGFWRVLRVTPFTRLAKLLNAALQPAPGALDDPGFREQHLRLLFRVLIGALPVVAAGDGVSRHTLAHTPEGLAEIRAPALGLAGWVRWARGRMTGGPGPAPQPPDATITFADRETTDAALLGRLDPNAAVGLGKVDVRGLVPLADGLSLVMDRVEVYLKPAGAATPGEPTLAFSAAAGEAPALAFAGRRLHAACVAAPSLKIIVEKHTDGYVAYPLGLARGVIVGQGGSYEDALADVRSAIRFHLETFGPDSLTLSDDSPVLEAFVAEAAMPV